MLHTAVHHRSVGRRSNSVGPLWALAGLATLALTVGSLQADEPAGQTVKKPTLGDLIDKTAESIVRINVLSGSGEAVGHGSGFVVDGKGYIVTNYHVTRAGAKVVVEFRDGTKHEVKGYRALDREGDIAILELAAPPQKLSVLPLGPKTPPRQGDSIIAIGHPHGLNFTVTTGIISAVRKTSELPKEVLGQVRAPADRLWIQTSAPISPGNSGGPLLDEYGQVVGVSTWIAEGQNLGFGIHVSHVIDLLASAPAKTLPLSAESSSRDVENPLDDPQPRIRELLRDYQKAAFEFRRLLAQTEGERERRKIADTENPAPTFAKRFYDVAESDRRTLTAFQALFMACQLDATAKEPVYLPKALARLLEDHAEDKGMQQVASTFAQLDHKAVPGFLRQVIAKSPHRKVRGLCCFSLAVCLGSSDDAERIQLLESCQKDYQDVPLGEQTLGKLAPPLLYRIRFLTVGRTAPEIQGRDLNGMEFKLSEYRGKVVLLDFFADWCPHCVRMYPHERKLVKEYDQRPFVLLGISTDSTDALKQLVQDKKVTWRCWADGQKGPIANEWQIESFPTLYLLDTEGVIRQTYVGRPDEKVLEQNIKDLVEKAEKGKP